jgi:hypothetical protein
MGIDEREAAKESADAAWAGMDEASDNAILEAALNDPGPMSPRQRDMVDGILLRMADPKRGIAYTRRTLLGRILSDEGPIAWVIRGIGSLIGRG